MKFLMNWFGAVMLAVLLFPLRVLAEIAPVPDSDAVVLVMKLVAEWKVLGPVGIGIVLVMLAVQAIKALVPEDFKYKRLAVLLLAMIYMGLVSVSAGGSVGAAVLGVLITSGGAMALYEALKGVGIISKA